MGDVSKLLKLAAKQNVAEDLTDEQLTKIGLENVRLTQSDDASREEWKKRSEDAMKIALQVVEEKSFPWQNASNVKYPTVTVSALAFHARTLPAILSGNKIAKAKVTGEDKDGEKEATATRVADYLNYQILHEMAGWEEDMDKLLLALPIEGCEFKKTYFSPAHGTNISEWIRPEDFIVHYKTKSFDDCPRSTHRFWLHPQYITERQRMGIWLDNDLNISKTDMEDEVVQEFYEQHCLLDLDDDGYKEPWCVTVHVNSSKVVRIKADFTEEDIAVKVGSVISPLSEVDEAGLKKAKIAKIDRIQYFTKYSFIPSPDGGFYDIGLGQIVGPINETISTIINQLIDGGTWQNIAGNSGFAADGVSISNKRGAVGVTMGEFKKIKLPAGMTDIRQGIMPMPASGPSAVLFNTLGMLIGAAKDIAGVQDIHTGGTERNETATTTMIRVEEGQKVFNAIFKRIYRSIGQELTKIYELNAIYLEPETYFRVLDTDVEGVVKLTDFRNDGTDVQPIADPSMSNTATKMAKAEFLQSFRGDPSINQDEITRRMLEAADVTGIDSLIIPEDKRPAPPPDPAMEELAVKVQQMKNADETADAKVVIEQFRAEIEAFKAETERFKAEADAASKFSGGSDAALAILNKMLTDLDSMESNLDEEEDEMDEAVSGIEQETEGAQGAPQAPIAPQMGEGMPQGDVMHPMPMEAMPTDIPNA